MKLLRYGPIGKEQPGALDAQGNIRDLSLLIPDFTPDWEKGGTAQYRIHCSDSADRCLW